MDRRQLEIVTPCTQDWAGMKGTSTVRHCESCSKRVYNVSMLTQREAEAALAVRPDEVCVIYYLDTDGEVVFYPEGSRARRSSARQALAAAATASALAACSPAAPVETSAEAVVIAPTVALANSVAESQVVKPPASAIAHDFQPPQHVGSAAPTTDAAQAESCDEPAWNDAFKEKHRSQEHLRKAVPKPGGLGRRRGDADLLNPYRR